MAPKLTDAFEDSLLIIKPDYMHKKKHVLLYLMALGYQLQGRRLVNFSPELAAEFYKEGSEETWFMLQVILLSKGNSEAFIFAKKNCIVDLYNTMICYFRSNNEMDRFVYVSKSKKTVLRDITFIFPNYIYEPILFFDKNEFVKTDYAKEVIGALYEFKDNADPDVDWKEALAQYLVENEESEPTVLNQCNAFPTIQTMDAVAQTSLVMIGNVEKSRPAPESPKTPPSKPCASSSRSSRLLSSSSCISCGRFSSDQPKGVCDDFICGRVTPLELSSREAPKVCAEEVEPEHVPESEMVGETLAEGVGTGEGGLSQSEFADDFFAQGMDAEGQPGVEIADTDTEPPPAEPVKAEEPPPPPPAKEATPPPAPQEEAPKEGGGDAPAEAPAEEAAEAAGE